MNPQQSSLEDQFRQAITILEQLGYHAEAEQLHHWLTNPHGTSPHDVIAEIQNQPHPLPPQFNFTFNNFHFGGDFNAGAANIGSGDFSAKDIQYSYSARESEPHQQIKPLSKQGADLLKLLTNKSVHVRREAIRTAGLTQDIRAIEPLTGALNDRNEEVRRYAAWALEQLGPASVEALITSLKDKTMNVRADSAWILARIQDERAMVPLGDALCLAEERIKVPYPAFVSGYVDPTNHLLYVDTERGEFIFIDEDVRAYIDGLANFGEHAIQTLTRLFFEGTPNIQEAAIRALAQIEDKGLVNLFLGSLTSTSDKVRVYAVYGLAKNCGLTQAKDIRPVHHFIEILKEQPISESLFVCTLWALAVIGDPGGVKIVLNILRRCTGEHRSGKYHAIGGLGLSGSKMAVPTLLPFLQDADAYVRECTAQALGRINDVRAVEPLILALDDESRGVRSRAAEALGQIGDKRAVKPLLHHFGDPDSEIHSVAQALYQLRAFEVIDDLQRIANQDERGWIRRQATELIRKLSFAEPYSGANPQK